MQQRGREKKKEKKEIVHYTYQIPKLWKKEIEEDGIFPLLSMKRSYQLFGWGVDFRNSNKMLEIYLRDLSEEYGEEDYFMSFTLEDIENGIYHSGEIDDFLVKLRCVWCVWEKTEDEFKEQRGRERKVIPPNLHLEALKNNMGSYKKANTYEERLMELIDCEFIFDGLGWFVSGVFHVVEILDEHGVYFKSKEGQDILRKFTNSARDEIYGGVNMYYNCDKCLKEITLDSSLEQVNAILSDEAFCQECIGTI